MNLAEVRQKSKRSNEWRISTEMRADVRDLTKTSLLTTLLVLLCNWMALVGVAVAVAHLRNWWWLLTPALWIMTLRALRAFENLTHEASHYNWCRMCPNVNDALGDWFCAGWVGLGVASFRKTHQLHHADFDGESDPCRPRYEALKFDALDRRQYWTFVNSLFCQIVPYVCDYWSAYGGEEKLQLARTLGLHAVLIVAGTFIVPGFWWAWLLGVVFPFVVILPFLRIWAEASKHRYDGMPELDATYNNIGLFDRWIIHPASDGWHLVHHFQPKIPHHRLAQAHALLSRHHPKYAAHNKVRKGLFEEPDRN
jgi:fatty acid desaturase